MPKLGMEEIRKEQVIAATRKCIVEKGVLHLSIKDVAAEAGVSTGVIYYYFENKQDLLLQVLKETFRRSHDRVIESLAPLDSGREKLFKHIENISIVPEDNPEFFPLLMNYLAQARHNPEFANIIKKFFGNLRSFIREYLDQGIEGNEIDPDLAEQLPVMILAMGLGMGVMWTIEPDSFDISSVEAAWEKLIDNTF
ncbi:MAG: TetR/AcrR family transcriptional regulator [Desulfobacteraceae bacterium]|nr:TetR/AcrR family transcriptional regulator [Desulfobacteraceae bacterium]